MVNIEYIKQEFPVKNHYLYFNFASDGPLPVSSKNAIIDALEEKSKAGKIPDTKQSAIYELLRDELSMLFKSKRENFAFIKNTSEGILLALLLLNIRPEENYVVAQDAFPTTVKMMECNCPGEMRAISINSPTPITDQLLKVIDNKTRVIVLDWVHYCSGKIININAISQLAREKNIFTIIDGMQGAGALAIDLEASAIDFFLAGGNKWLLSPQGSGVIYISDQVWEKKERRSLGWLGYDWQDYTDFDMDPELRPGAAVMEYGTRSYLAAAGLLASLKLINKLGIVNIETHNRKLRHHFIEGILTKGYQTIHNNKSASIIPFKSATADVQSLKETFDKQKIITSERNGYIRTSFHLVNHLDEVTTFLDHL
jgi:selenocysteine lyase/cysteine desulfurase